MEYPPSQSESKQRLARLPPVAARSLNDYRDWLEKRSDIRISPMAKNWAINLVGFQFLTEKMQDGNGLMR
jgi:hypothetical protein